ncbi:hypothetical protein [Mesorhizobium escarrei]|uniref:Uncharacterized protein n=1 Tax=Mesorhizobium escarrei TaxID=666018 RepID=A0ABM9DSH3_9HYPH|nr:hypothetical protein MES5069_230029 [Mesorhizobium escarrei]
MGDGVEDPLSLRCEEQAGSALAVRIGEGLDKAEASVLERLAEVRCGDLRLLQKFRLLLPPEGIA